MRLLANVCPCTSGARQRTLCHAKWRIDLINSSARGIALPAGSNEDRTGKAPIDFEEAMLLPGRSFDRDDLIPRSASKIG